jgi:hypothetical protein
MPFRKSKILINVAAIVAALAVYGLVPAYGTDGQARMLIAIFAMVIAKATIEFFLSRRKQKEDESQNDNRPTPR